MGNKLKYVILNLVGLVGAFIILLIGIQFPEWASSTTGTVIGMTSLVIYIFPLYYAWRIDLTS